jgi:hypothetical protein
MLGKVSELQSEWRNVTSQKMVLFTGIGMRNSNPTHYKVDSFYCSLSIPWELYDPHFPTPVFRLSIYWQIASTKPVRPYLLCARILGRAVQPFNSYRSFVELQVKAWNTPVPLSEFSWNLILVFWNWIKTAGSVKLEHKERTPYSKNSNIAPYMFTGAKTLSNRHFTKGWNKNCYLQYMLFRNYYGYLLEHEFSGPCIRFFSCTWSSLQWPSEYTWILSKTLNHDYYYTRLSPTRRAKL